MVVSLTWSKIFFESATKDVRADWPAVEELAAELHTLVSDSILAIRTTANDDDVTVGAAIGLKLDAASLVATEVLNIATQEIADRTMTEDSARGHLQNLEGILLQLQADLQEEVNQLSLGAQNSIRATFTNAYMRAQVIANEIYDALNRN